MSETVQVEPTYAYLSNNALASDVIDSWRDGILPKLRDLAPLLQELRNRFKLLKGNDTIAECRTWTQFVEQKLQRSLRSVQLLLAEQTRNNFASSEPEPEVEPEVKPENADTTESETDALDIRLIKWTAPDGRQYSMRTKLRGHNLHAFISDAWEEYVENSKNVVRLALVEKLRSLPTGLQNAPQHWFGLERPHPVTEEELVAAGIPIREKVAPVELTSETVTEPTNPVADHAAWVRTVIYRIEQVFLPHDLVRENIRDLVKSKDTTPQQRKALAAALSGAIDRLEDDIVKVLEPIR